MNNQRSEVFAPASPPAPPESGLAEVIGDPASSYYDGMLDDDYTVAMAADEPELDLVVPKPEVVQEVTVAPSSYKRARRFHADTPFVLGLLLFLVALLAAASFYVSFSGLYAAAAWAVGPNPPLQFAVPVMLDVAIVAFTLSLFVERERGDKVRWTWFAIAVFALASATANILHTLEVSTAVNMGQLIVGAVISGGAPILLAFSTDKAAVKVFKNAVE